jgi:hypothetical protein
VPAAVKAMQPLMERVRTATSTRATVELSAETIIDGAVVNKEPLTYQVASTAPDRFTVYLKGKQQRTRVYCDGTEASIALSPTAFVVLDEPIAMQQAVFQLPVPLGPYPEVVLALTLAGVDPGLTLATGMKSMRLVGPEQFRGETPAVHIAGVQDDGVRWDLWITRGKAPKPLRLRVDLTDMLRANGSLSLPAGYRYVLRMDFKLWRLDQDNKASLYRYKRIEGAQQYDSVAAYYRPGQGEQAAAPDASASPTAGAKPADAAAAAEPSAEGDF